jgi:hypothetical protein
MPAEIVHRRKKVREFYGNPPWSTFYAWLAKGLIPAPDIQLGKSTPGWTDGLITRHQEERRLAAAGGRERRVDALRRVRSSPRKNVTLPRPPP